MHRFRYTAMVFLCCAAFIGALGYIALAPTISETPHDALPTIQLAGETVRVTVAEEDAERAQGLSGRSGLAEDESMLFVFPEDGVYGFWMKDMQFSIDILWLAEGGEVVFMAQNVSPDSYPRVFTSDIPARYVLELPAGWAERYNVRVGDAAAL